MIPVGYMAKRVTGCQAWLDTERVKDIYSVSACVSENFADYISDWKHNGYSVKWPDWTVAPVPSGAP